MNYFITGGTGFIGSALIQFLLTNDKNAHVIALVRNKQLAMDRFCAYDGRIIFIEDTVETFLENKILESCEIHQIVHCAAPTQSTYMISYPIETFEAIAMGTRNVLELARRHKVQSMIYLSSMEVYGSVEDTGLSRTEAELGEIDLSSARSCYPLGKRVAEHYCHLYQQQYGIPVKIARLAQVFGQGVRTDDKRVFMQFARALRNSTDIVLKTDGSSMGNYCCTEDAVSAIFTILNKGQNGEVYNVVNEENTMSIREMAELVCGYFGNDDMNVVIKEEDNAKTGYAPKTGLRLSAKKLRSLGWKPTKGVVEMYKDVMNHLLAEEALYRNLKNRNEGEKV